jgi:hypothetical protein
MRPFDDVDRSTARRTARWRRRLLRDAGMAPELARAVASDERFDVHELLRLLESGCPPSLAIDIVAPLDDRRLPT